mgnify:CR=1 FL=1
MTEKESILQCPMAKLENLLVATDGTTFSEGAIQESITLAKVFYDNQNCLKNRISFSKNNLISSIEYLSIVNLSTPIPKANPV